MIRNFILLLSFWVGFTACTDPLIKSFQDSDVTVTSYVTLRDTIVLDTITPTRDDNMLLGNPSKAKNSKNNFLLRREQFTLSYNNSKGRPNWVSWHLSPAWKGDADRDKARFKPDSILIDLGFDVIVTKDYTNSGFDRGHQCPANDRDGSQDDLYATFYMSNILPQAPKVNQQIWKDLEDYCNNLIKQGYELYIVCGGYGTGGVIETPDGVKKIKKIGNKINVPSNLWKIIVVLPLGDNDISRINHNTRIIAVDIPNDDRVAKKEWYEYRTSVYYLEEMTNYDFIRILPDSLEQKLELKRDTIEIK